jgi:hypothetical protein
MPWELGYFEQQAADAAAALGQVTQTVANTVGQAVTAAIPAAAPVATGSEASLEQVLSQLQTIQSNLPPTKNQVAIDPTTGDAVTVATKVGTVTWLDRLKGAYKWLIAFIGFLLVVLNQGLAFADILPQNVANWINVAITLLTSVSVFLKANEHWVDGTPEAT